MNKIGFILKKPGLVRAFLHLSVFSFFVVSANAAVYQIETPANDSPEIRRVLEYYQSKIENVLDIEYVDTVTVIIAADTRSFNSALGSAFPDWGAAAAIKERKLIVIKSPAHFQTGKGLEELLGHELGHLMLDTASGRRPLPRWFEEGFCQLISGEWRFTTDLLVTRAVWGSGLIPLGALESVNSFGGAKASLAYAQSYLAVSSLVQEFGIEFVPDFLSNYRQSGNFYEAFFNATGYRYLEWVNLWQKKIADRYRLVLYIFDSSVLFPLLAILFILLYLVKLYYTRKKKKQWELEEKYKGDEQSFST